jgi:hypothetical protein
MSGHWTTPAGVKREGGAIAAFSITFNNVLHIQQRLEARHVLKQ